MAIKRRRSISWTEEHRKNGPCAFAPATGREDREEERGGRGAFWVETVDLGRPNGLGCASGGFYVPTSLDWDYKSEDTGCAP